MTKTITVKGVGKISVRPDHIVISMKLVTTNKAYDKAMTLAAERIAELTECLAKVGFAKTDLKTTGFHVHTDYDNIRKKDGNYEQVFRGYVVEHNLKIEFSFDTERLSKALDAVGSSSAHPTVSIRFTVKDPAAVNEALLRAATENALRKAEILCDAAGRKLGELLSIDYNWGELNIRSNTTYDVGERERAVVCGAPQIDFEPDDIDVQDSAAFVWEII